jgi:hypothetical protein
MHSMTWLTVLVGGALLCTLPGCANSVTMAPARDDSPPAPVGAAKAKSPTLIALANPPKGTHQQTVWLGADPDPAISAIDPDDVPAPGTMGALPQTASDLDDLEIVNDSLKGKLAVLRIESSRSDSNLLAVLAGIKNQTSRRLDLEVQTVYRDKDGNSLSSGAGTWMTLTLKPHQETQYRSEAISEDATHFVVRVRHAAGTAEASQ